MPNPLTRRVAQKLGPVVLGTLLKHYFDRVKKEAASDGTAITQLRQDELLYDEAFNIIKRSMSLNRCGAYSHSVEELQAFSVTRTPSPPWVHAIRAIVPMSCCDEAASLIIQALGGEEHATRLVGGTKWWQLRDITGIAGEWMMKRKDWQEAKKRRKAFEKKNSGSTPSPPLQESTEGLPPSGSEPTNSYDEDMDELPCILYTHGGGYYFGSVDQERYCIQRHARKINGRVFAINYRLAPQYPFPCALQDLVAAWLTLALLQVLRDTGQPLPAGGVLISPWCDLTHSFPSIHTNTATDILPLHGLSLQRPSALWPPPSKEMMHKVHTGLRQRIRQMVHLDIKGDKACGMHLTQDTLAGSNLSPSGNDGTPRSSDMPIDVGATVSLPSADETEDQTIYLMTKSGEQITLDSQIHLYTQNTLVAHPLVSPALTYLGGLPPLFFMASDKEVLRDEIIYSAHKAADPSRYPVTDAARALYPPLVGIEERHAPTPVHFQVYDDTAHVLPVLFPFTTPGKYCYRAIATFTKHVTGMSHPLKSTSSSLVLLATTPRPVIIQTSHRAFWTLLDHTKSSPNIRPSFSIVRRPSRISLRQDAATSEPIGVRYAGEASVYCNEEGLPSWKEGMIRERVSTQGVIRPLEPADQLDALHVPPEIIGALSERAKYAKEVLAIEKRRNRNIDLAKEDISKNLPHLPGVPNGKGKGKAKETRKAFKAGQESFSGSMGWVWADERPPPSSIVSRRDTDEARKLARIVDQAALQDDTDMSGNSLWAAVVNFLTPTPEKEHYVSESEASEPPVERHAIKKSKSVFASLRARRKASMREGLSE
ncbi:Alpha/Beta hydrolase protein [Melanogaster broomeanus]|nr:Alpha/Beta hydrolase protein [Melanogaster broomeanus]